MDAAGKDGTIKHVMSGINPQGCQVTLVQGALGARAEPRFSLALQPRAAGAGHGSASSIAAITRRCWSCACTGKCSRRERIPAAAGDEKYLEAALRGHQRLRAVPDAQRRGDPQIFPAPLQGGAKKALSRAAGRSVEELEIFRRRFEGARTIGTNTRKPTRT